MLQSCPFQSGVLLLAYAKFPMIHNQQLTVCQLLNSSQALFRQELRLVDAFCVLLYLLLGLQLQACYLFWDLY